MSHNVQDNKAYFIVNVKGGTVIDQSASDGAVIGYPKNGGDNQKWIAERIEGEHGGWHLRNAQSGKYLSLPSQKPQNDTKLLANDTKFLWHIWGEDAVQDAVRICVPGTKKDVDLSDHGNAAPGTPISVWGRWEGQNQMWFFQEGGLKTTSPNQSNY